MATRSTLRGALALGCLLVSVAAGSARPAPAATGYDRFAAAYEGLLSRADAGTVDRETVAAAEALRFELDKQRIRADAEIEILRLEAARAEGGELVETLDRLVAQVAGLEAAAWTAFVELQRLLDGGGSGGSAVGGDSEATTAPAVSRTPPDAPEEGADAEKRTLQITFEPEEFVDDPPP